MRRTLAWMAIPLLIACGSANEEPTSAPAPAAKAETATPPEPQAPSAPATAATRSPSELWTWAGDGEPGDVEADLKTCEDALAEHPRGGPKSPVLVRLQISVACMVERGWEPRRGKG